MKTIILFSCLFLSSKVFSQKAESFVEKGKNQNDLIETYVTNCAEKYNYNFEMNDWQNCLDEGLKKDSTIAYLWQQKAMPYFKAKKYEVGMTHLNKAVLLDAKRWQPYRAFIKCIFQKSYKESILDFQDCINKWGNQYEMDHTYEFYIALCYLQLNEFNKAEVLLSEYINGMLKKNGEDWIHPTALFYYGISLYEQKKFNEAIFNFDRALKLYKNFSDAKVYKAICMTKLNKNNLEAMKLLKEGREDAKMGYSINEDNTIYETYPYQKKWKDQN